MNRLGNPLYVEDLELVASCGANWSVLDGATVGVSGATGMVGTLLVDALMHMARTGRLDVRVVALGRSEERARTRLPYFNDSRFAFEELDVSVPGARPHAAANVVVHLASTTHPRAYATQPIGTITSNVVGLQNLLEWQLVGGADGRFVFASSVEIYGENRGDVERFAEDYCGQLDCNTLRAAYPEAKRLCEALCQAYAAERGAHVYVPRLPRIFGPTLLPSDTKALSQFLHKAVAGKDVVLKSEGTQTYSYLYVTDAVSALLWVLTRGDEGVAYNAADERCDVALRDLAACVAKAGGGRVVFDLPDEVERAGYSTATKAMLDASRLRALGWRAHYGIEDGIARTVAMLRQLG
ncbi:MAG: NAD(P)-dependent oxidoreductase [Coriobacteriales bacterium]|nr:NAD(P)-dependent oxidoreductase [Coriobacteriales bacterium]